MDVRVSSIPLQHLESVFDEAKETLVEQKTYNSKFHTLEDLLKYLPLSHIPQDPVLPWILIEPWLDLVMRSQGLSDTDVHKIKLPRPFLDQSLLMSRAAIIQGHLSTNPEELQFLADLAPKRTVQGVDIDQLLHEEKFFARLDTCSLKDALSGTGPLKNSKDLWARLTTSARGAAGIECLMSGREQRSVYLFLLKWNDKMRPELEYRVFCGPGSKRITAVSQYKWHERWYHASEPLTSQSAILKRIWKSTVKLHQEIIRHPAMTEDIMDRGFVFDILEDPDNGNTVKLIELNDFGAMTGCGSCLFHWLRHAEMLYGLKKRVRFRLVI